MIPSSVNRNTQLLMEFLRHLPVHVPDVKGYIVYLGDKVAVKPCQFPLDCKHSNDALSKYNWEIESEITKTVHDCLLISEGVYKLAKQAYKSKGCVKCPSTCPKGCSHTYQNLMKIASNLRKCGKLWHSEDIRTVVESSNTIILEYTCHCVYSIMKASPICLWRPFSVMGQLQRCKISEERQGQHSRIVQGMDDPRHGPQRQRKRGGTQKKSAPKKRRIASDLDSQLPDDRAIRVTRAASKRLGTTTSASDVVPATPENLEQEDNGVSDEYEYPARSPDYAPSDSGPPIPNEEEPAGGCSSMSVDACVSTRTQAPRRKRTPEGTERIKMSNAPMGGSTLIWRQNEVHESSAIPE